MTMQDLEALIALAEHTGCFLLVDETYRDLNYSTALPLAASLSDRVISVSSLSKAYGVPGIRMGWMITRHPAMQEVFLAAKEQISICGSTVDEWVGLQILRRKAELLSEIVPEMQRRLALIKEWIANEPLLEWVPPAGGVVCFPRIKAEPQGGYDSFYRVLLAKYGTYVGPGHWFQMSDRYFRLGYGWPSADELSEGLKAISSALRV
jgi:aspartate/methionine/tyrosine aminotransferase